MYIKCLYICCFINPKKIMKQKSKQKLIILPNTDYISQLYAFTSMEQINYDKKKVYM